MKPIHTILYSILLILIGYSFVGVGFVVPIDAYDEIHKSILVSFGILFWSFYAGNGYIWLLLSMFCMYLVLKEKKIAYAMVLQALASFALGYTISIGWILYIT